MNSFRIPNCLARCANQTCPSCELCCRFMDRRDEEFLWFSSFAPTDGDDKCEAFIPPRDVKRIDQPRSGSA